jgi:hypothetical protein
VYVERAELSPARCFSFFAALLQSGFWCWQTRRPLAMLRVYYRRS